MMLTKTTKIVVTESTTTLTMTREAFLASLGLKGMSDTGEAMVTYQDAEGNQVEFCVSDILEGSDVTVTLIEKKTEVVS
jgi:hypothetical protein